MSSWAASSSRRDVVANPSIRRTIASASARVIVLTGRRAELHRERSARWRVRDATRRHIERDNTTATLVIAQHARAPEPAYSCVIF